MTASRELLRAAVVAMCCSPESRHTPGCARECTFGWGWIGTWRTPRVRCSYPCAVTLVSESHSSFGCISGERRNDEYEKTRAIGNARFDVCADGSSANQAYRNARRRNDLKLLSIRGETAPRTPVWRSKRRSQFDRWKS